MTVQEVVLAWPAGFLEWAPWWQALALGVSTLVQEDVPAWGAAWLVAAGALGWPAGFLGVFLGIWIGDALLYWLARAGGRPVLAWRGVRRWVDPGAVARSERWFAERGTWLLVASRFVPGTRLPTYLAAGFLRLSFPRFLGVTGLAVGVWTGGLFLGMAVLGNALAARGLEADRFGDLGRWGSVGLAVVAAGGWGLWWAVRRMLGRRTGGRGGLAGGASRSASGPLWRRWAERWRRWEFWPAWLFYAPVALWYLGLSIRHRGLTVPTSANPGIFAGGIVGESKWATLRELVATSPEFTAETWLVEGGTPGERVAHWERLCGRHDVGYPMVLKPDVGQRGAGVKMVRTREQALAYLEQVAAPVLLQRYAPGPREVGIFYVRRPGEERGRIWAITLKEFPVLVGDGRRTLEELIRADDRARWMAEVYLRRWSARRGDILPAGESLRLVEAGNHAQGCIFRDGADLWSEALEARVDAISRRLDGFCIGRYDLRYATDDDLRAGRNFSIVELNGAAAEATSIYDARHRVTTAYRTLFRQWSMVFAIGAEQRRRGVRPMRLSELWRAWRRTSAWVAAYPAAD